MSVAKFEKIQDCIVEVSLLSNGKQSKRDAENFSNASSQTESGIRPSLHENQTGYRFIEAHNTQAKNIEERNYPELQDVGQDLSGKWIIPCSPERVDEKWQIVKDLVNAGLVFEAKVACINDEYPENSLFVYIYNSNDLQAVAKMHDILRAHGVVDEEQTITYKMNRSTLDNKYTPDTIRYTSDDIISYSALAALDAYVSLPNQIWAAVKAFFGFGLSEAKQSVAQQLKTDMKECHSNAEILQRLGACRERNTAVIINEQTHSSSLFQSQYNPANKGELGQILDQIEQSLNRQVPKL